MYPDNAHNYYYVLYCHVKLAFLLTPSVSQPACKNVRAERSRDAPANSIFSGPITHLLSLLCVWMKNFSHASATKKTKMLNVLGENEIGADFDTLTSLVTVQ